MLHRHCHRKALDKDPGDGFVSSSNYLSSFTIGRSGRGTEKRLPMPLLGAALAIGINLAAKISESFHNMMFFISSKLLMKEYHGKPRCGVGRLPI
ncbi:hypothetical protein V6N13_089517 [Hibiscus sabdariffa]